jgi:hypothetical protein
MMCGVWSVMWDVDPHPTWGFRILDFGFWSKLGVSYLECRIPGVVSVSSYAQRVFWALWGGLVPGLVLVLLERSGAAERRTAGLPPLPLPRPPRRSAESR